MPLGLGLLNISNPRVTVMDTLSKLTHDADAETAQCAIFALGLIGAGSLPVAVTHSVKARHSWAGALCRLLPLCNVRVSD